MDKVVNVDLTFKTRNEFEEKLGNFVRSRKAVTNGIRLRHWGMCWRGRWLSRGWIVRPHIG